jgi:hypothetical protein
VKNIVVAIIVPLVIIACTTTDEIIIDQKGVNMSAYQQDLAECQTYAKQVKTGEKATKGAASGAQSRGPVWVPLAVAQRVRTRASRVRCRLLSAASVVAVIGYLTSSEVG